VLAHGYSCLLVQLGLPTEVCPLLSSTLQVAHVREGLKERIGRVGSVDTHRQK
jgi:hypothetical protein